MNKKNEATTPTEIPNNGSNSLKKASVLATTRGALMAPKRPQSAEGRCASFAVGTKQPANKCTIRICSRVFAVNRSHARRRNLYRKSGATQLRKVGLTKLFADLGVAEDVQKSIAAKIWDARQRVAGIKRGQVCNKERGPRRQVASQSTTSVNLRLGFKEQAAEDNRQKLCIQFHALPGNTLPHGQTLHPKFHRCSGPTRKSKTLFIRERAKNGLTIHKL